MLFVAQGTIKPTSDPQDRFAQRLNWDYPEGVRVIGEYWVQSNHNQVVTIFEADDNALLAQMRYEWEPYINFTVSPAVAAETGIEMLRALAAEPAAV